MRVENPGRHGQEPAAALLDIIREFLAGPSEGGSRPLSLDSLLETELGLDLAARLRLRRRVERRFAVLLSAEAFLAADTPRDLLQILRQAGAPAATGTPDAPTSAPAEPLQAPDQARTFPEVLDWHLERHPDQLQVRFYQDDREGASITFRRLAQEAQRVAAGLQRRGLAAGERVAIMLPTGPDYLYAFLGTLLAGGVPVPLYPPLRKSQLESHLRRQRGILTNCGAVALIALPEGRLLARLLRAQLPALKHLVTVEELDREPEDYRRPRIAGSDTAFLQYTSGSTGHPKGVVLSHANLLANIRAMGRAVAMDRRDVLVSWLPLYHDMGLIGCWLTSIYYATPLVLFSPLDFLRDPGRWLRAIHRYRGTLSPAPNFAYEFCLARLGDRDLEGLDLSAWRGAFSGAEPVHPGTVETFCERLAPCGFRREALMPVYGLAECCVGLTFPPLHRGPRIDRVDRRKFTATGVARPARADDSDSLPFVACGKPLDGHQVRIVDASGQVLPERREGRVQFRGPSACGGYFDDPEATSRLFAEEWLNTGDLGYLADAELFLTGRSKDVIIIAGRNLYPQELEAAVGELAGIRKGNVAAFGSLDPRRGSERLVLVAETRETDPSVRQRLRREINTLARELVGTVPAAVVLAPPQTVLKTSSGKICRAACRERYERGTLGSPRPLWWQLVRVGFTTLGATLRRGAKPAASLGYAGYVWSLYGLAAPLVGLAVVLLPRRAWRQKLLHGSLALLLRLSRLPVAVRGLEFLPETGPCIIVANHASYLDRLLLSAVLDLDLSFVVRSASARRALLAPFLRRIGTEFAERFDRRNGAKSVRRFGRQAWAGCRLTFFPEGSFSRTPGVRRFDMGAFVAAADAEVPIVPVAIRGTRDVLRDGSWFPHYRPVSVQIGRPLSAGGDPAEPSKDCWKRALWLCAGARRHILRYCGEPDMDQDPGRPERGATGA